MPDSVRHHDGHGVQAYRWLVMGALAAIGILSFRVLNQVDSTAEAAARSLVKIERIEAQMSSMQGQMSEMKTQVSKLESAVDSVKTTTNLFDGRIAVQEQRLGVLERQLSKQLEDMQRQMWQRK